MLTIAYYEEYRQGENLLKAARFSGDDMAKKVFFHTFGCKVNSCDSEMASKLLETRGFDIADDLADADIVVVNSCAVTAAAERKSRAFVRSAKRLNPEAATVLIGCYAQAYPEKAAALEEADVVAGNAAIEDLPALIEHHLERRERIADFTPHGISDKLWHVELNAFRGHTRAFLKAEDGCEHACSYCVVPSARGFVRSLLPDGINRQARAFADSGYKEIVLTGINLASYGKEEGLDLADAVRAAQVPGIERIRLSSLEPDLLPDSLIDRLAGCEKLCAHFHLSLQSGCDRTLRAMGRRYSAGEYMQLADKIRGAFDSPTFTTDIMTGFPTESDEDFCESLRFAAEFGFLKCHVFPYSVRPGTKAALLEQLPKSLREERAKMMAAAVADGRRRVLAGQIGKTVGVIVESETAAGVFEGYSERYFRVLIEAEGIKPGDLVSAVITGANGETTKGRFCGHL